jgi:hypothetical protein
MGNFIKRPQTVLDVGIADNNGSSTRVSEFIRLSHSRSSSFNIEKTRGDFEKNTIEENKKYFINDDNNPLVYGLKALDRTAMVIAGKNSCSTMMFTDHLTCSTPNFIKTTSLTEANIISLRTMEMDNAITPGIRMNRPQAIAFNNLSLNITREVQRGVRVYSKYIEDVFILGNNAILEWINNGV